eukprot:15469581-Alexandrium_andersonii.AAC.1
MNTRTPERGVEKASARHAKIGNLTPNEFEREGLDRRQHEYHRNMNSKSHSNIMEGLVRWASGKEAATGQ